MKPSKFINQISQNFEEILSIGFIHNHDLKLFNNYSQLDSDHIEGLVMRLYFLSQDPDKEISFFINQYAENRYLYLIKLNEAAWLFALCNDSNFAKLHFYIKYMLSSVNFEFEKEEDQSEIKYTVEEEKLISAKRIQDLLLPDIDRFLSDFSEKHLFYSPKDIVGGDFYWAKTTKTHKWIVIGDCTGHSVEGALGSVSVMSVLNQVFEANMNPHNLIKALFEGLNNMQNQNLKQGYGIGCELMVIKFDPRTKVLNYSSNGLTMYQIADIVKVFKTKKSSLEPERVLKYIRSRKLQLTKGTALFMHSDGLPDQINESGKKLKSSAVRKALANKHSGEEIQKVFEDWKGSSTQTDDVVSLYLRL